MKLIAAMMIILATVGDAQTQHEEGLFRPEYVRQGQYWKAVCPTGSSMYEMAYYDTLPSWMGSYVGYKYDPYIYCSWVKLQCDNGNHNCTKPAAPPVSK